MKTLFYINLIIIFTISIVGPYHAFINFEPAKDEYIVVKQGEEINTIVKEYYTKILKDANVAAILDCKGIGMEGMLQMYLLEKVKQWNDSGIKCPNGKTYKECYNNFQGHVMASNNFDWEKHIKLVNPNILNM